MKLLFFLMVTLTTFTERSLHAWPEPTRGGSGVNLSGKMFTLSSYGSLVFYSPYEHPPWVTSTPYQTRGYASSTSTPSYTQTNTGTTKMSTPSTNAPTPKPWVTSTPYQTRGYASSTSTPSYTQTNTGTTKMSTPSTNAPTPKPWVTSTPYQTRGYASSTSTPSYTQTNTGTTKMSSTNAPTPKLTTRSTTRYPRPPTTYPWTTAPSTRGVSVCLRYITDSQSGSIFTLSPSSQYLRLDIGSPLSYVLTFNNYNRVYLQPHLKLWPYLTSNVWTSICFTVDNAKAVVQMFRDSNMSSRKLLNNQYVWSGERVMEFSNVEGQITDVQVWDYPLCYQEVLYYMSNGVYGFYQGSVLSWSYISYSQTGRTLLEDGYELQMGKSNRKLGQKNHLKGGYKKHRKVFLFEERKKEQWKKEM